MAVFPDRIVLKSSSDSQAAIEAAIGSGGADAIATGELVIGLESGSASLYTLDSSGNVVTISGGSGGGGGGGGGGNATIIVSETEPTQQPDASALVEGNMWFKGSTSELSVYYSGAWALVASGGGGGGGGAPVVNWSVTADGTSHYIFSGDGFAGTETDPILYVVRGQTYRITNAMGMHPLQIQSTAGIGGTSYDDGITGNPVSDGTLVWEVRLDAPAELYYQCTAHPDMNGTIQVLENSSGGGGGGGGAGELNDLSDVDTTGEAAAKVLAYNGAQWVPVETLGVAVTTGGLSVDHGDLSEYPLLGINGFYASTSDMTNDGWTLIAGSEGADDSAITFTPDAKWNGIDFLDNGIPSGGTWSLNSNGGVMYDTGGSTSQTIGGGSALTQGANIDFYVAVLSADAALRRAGMQEYNDGSKNWLVIRCDFNLPYNNSGGGYPAEVWFGEDGAVSIRYADKVGGAADMQVGPTKNVIVQNGTAIFGPWPEYTGTDGNYGVVYGMGTTTVGPAQLQLKDLTDVDDALSPQAGDSLIYDAEASVFKTGNPLAGERTDALVLFNFDAADDPNDFGASDINANITTDPIPYTGYSKFGAGSYYINNTGFNSSRILLDEIKTYTFGTTAWTMEFWWSSADTAYSDDDPDKDRPFFHTPFSNPGLNVFQRTDTSNPSADSSFGQVVPSGTGGQLFLAVDDFNPDWGIGTTTDICDLDWHHVVFQCTGADENGDATYTCFVDGVVQQTSTIVAIDFAPAGGSLPNYSYEMGRIYGRSGGHIIATIDSFAIYKGAIYDINGFDVPTAPATASVAVGGYVSSTDLKAIVAASTDFADFQTRIAAL